jgi:hypothetical protein
MLNMGESTNKRLLISYHKITLNSIEKPPGFDQAAFFV